MSVLYQYFSLYLFIPFSAYKTPVMLMAAENTSFPNTNSEVSLAKFTKII